MYSTLYKKNKVIENTLFWMICWIQFFQTKLIDLSYNDVATCPSASSFMLLFLPISKRILGSELFCGTGKCIYRKEFLEKVKAEREKLWHNLTEVDNSKKFLRNLEAVIYGFQ